MFNKKELQLIKNYCRENIATIENELLCDPNICEVTKEALRGEIETAQSIIKICDGQL